MKRIRLGVLTLAFGLFSTSALYGQHPQPTEGIRFGVGGGITLPTGDYGTVDKAGWHVLGLIQLPISQSPIHLRFDAMYGSTSHKAGFGSGNTKLTGATADLVYHLGERRASVRPYVLGGLGIFDVSDGSSQSKFAFGLGGGILFGVGTMHAFAEARYISVQTSGSSLTFIPISVGLMFGR
jgi:outer membrane protein with beta-barrel domain